MAIKKRTATAPAPKKRPAAKKAKAETFDRSAEAFPFIGQELAGLCVPITQLALNPQNARKNDKAAPKLAELIRQHGFRVPVVADTAGVIRAGNTRYKAAKLIGMTHIPVLQQEFLSDAAATAFAIADNKSHEFSDWDNAILHELMKAGALPNRESLGFSEKEWKGLQLSDEPPKELKDIKLTGASKDVGEFVIVRFESAEEAEKFKTAFGMGRFERAIDFAKLNIEL
jgi:hypothetical protein